MADSGVTGVYSDLQIKDAIKAGKILVDPYNPKHVKGSSYDVSLGWWYYQTEARPQPIYNPFDEKNIERYFGKPKLAIPHKQYIQEQALLPFKGIPLNHPIIVLRPGERILGHTHEFIGISGNAGTTMMKARSTWGRNGISVCHDAGWGDPGYVNRWTMEIINLNKDASVPLAVGERVGQIVFFHTGEVQNPYRSKYQDADHNLSPTKLLASVKAAWRPEQMLPSAFKDKRPRIAMVSGLSVKEHFFHLDRKS